MSKRFLWVNNVPSILGGTLNCTHSMCQALPEYDHTVYSPRGQFGEREREVFQGVATLSEAMDHKDYDVIVYQNSPKAVVQSSKAKQIYYQHSVGGCYRHAQSVCDHTFFVSSWLKDQVDASGKVLYQPVTLPKERDFGPKPDHKVIVGRLCTPSKAKWVLDDWLPHFKQAAQIPNVIFELVGCPKEHHQAVKAALNHGKVELVQFFPANFEARSRLRRWDILLYTSSVKESYGRVVKEAQRSGCVPVVSNHSGLAEQISPGTGLTLKSVPDTITCVTHVIENLSAMKNTCQVYGDKTGSLASWRLEFNRETGL